MNLIRRLRIRLSEGRIQDLKDLIETLEIQESKLAQHKLQAKRELNRERYALEELKKSFAREHPGR